MCDFHGIVKYDAERKHLKNKIFTDYVKFNNRQEQH